MSDRPRILLVDDDEQSLALVRALLDPLPADVVCARSGAEALEQLAQGQFAVVLLDVAMPVMDGFETAQLIKERHETRHVPIIFMTGRIDEEYVRRGYAVGAVDYLLKPLDPEILQSKVAVFVDLARLRLQAEILTHRTLHDPLTGLPNRILFLDRLEHALARLERSESSVAVLFIDLDGFKTINDTLGHQAGDEVLVIAARRLRASIRASDTAARFAGDEFLVLCEDLTDEDEVSLLVERVAAVFAAPMELTAGDVRVSATIGVARTNDRAADPEELLGAADDDMLESKRASPTRART